MKHLFTTILVSRQHSQPCCAGTPGSIHECGGLGYAVSHTYSVALTIPIWLWLVSLATAKRRHGPLATRAFQQVSEPATDGVVLPTLLNGYKSANPYVLVSRSLTTSSGDGYARYFLEGSDPEKDARNIGSHVGRRLGQLIRLNNEDQVEGSDNTLRSSLTASPVLLDCGLTDGPAAGAAR